MYFAAHVDFTLPGLVTLGKTLGMTFDEDETVAVPFQTMAEMVEDTGGIPVEVEDVQ